MISDSKISTASPSVTADETLAHYQNLLLAVDASEHANRAISEAMELAKRFNSQVTGVHVYAAQLHDHRFRQMEGGLPEQFRVEDELERQRDIHDTLISKGLNIISDSYLDRVDRAAADLGVTSKRCILEGKNYRQLSREANSDNYDLLVMGGKGVGAIESSQMGSVALRTLRLSQIDTLIIRNPQCSLLGGPIVVALDGSEQSYAGLIRALQIAKECGQSLHLVAAFDPYYHYVAFNRIADVLSEEAGKVFRFEQQEQLHEEIIDSGLARIYQGHLQVGEAIAEQYGMKVYSELLTGKPYDAILKYMQGVKPALLVVGKRGIHADAELDIGSNSEQLVLNSPCAVLVVHSAYQPPLEKMAEVTISWSHEAEERLQQAPEFVQKMARIAIIRYAQQLGHTVITARIVAEAMQQMMPKGAREAMQGVVDHKVAQQAKPAEEAAKWLAGVDDVQIRDNLRLRAEKHARQQGRDSITLDDLQAVGAVVEADQDSESEIHWQAAALARLQRVPKGYCRDMTRRAAEAIARKSFLSEIELTFVEGLLETFKAGSSGSDATLLWDEDARTRIDRAPEMVQGMLVQEIEKWCQQNSHHRVTGAAVDAIKEIWKMDGLFHLQPDDPRNRGS